MRFAQELRALRGADRVVAAPEPRVRADHRAREVHLEVRVQDVRVEPVLHVANGTSVVASLKPLQSSGKHMYEYEL